MRVALVWLVTCLIWGTVWLFIKLGLRDLPPISFAGMRLLIAFTVLLPIIAVRRELLPRKSSDLWLIAVTGLLLLGLNYGLVFWGAQHVSSGLTAVLQAATPLFGLALAHRYLSDERITVVKLCAVIIGVVGVALIFSDQLQVAGTVALLACATIVGGAVCVAYAYVLVRAYGGHLHPTVLTAGQMFCALIPLLAVGYFREGSPLRFRWTATATASLLYLALAGSVAAFWLNYWLLKRVGATKVLLMSLVQPLIAVALGALVLGEALPPRTLLGGAFVLLGVGLVLWRRPRAALEADASA